MKVPASFFRKSVAADRFSRLAALLTPDVYHVFGRGRDLVVPVPTKDQSAEHQIVLKPSGRLVLVSHPGGRRSASACFCRVYLKRWKNRHRWELFRKKQFLPPRLGYIRRLLVEFGPVIRIGRRVWAGLRDEARKDIIREVKSPSGQNRLCPPGASSAWASIHHHYLNRLLQAPPSICMDRICYELAESARPGLDYHDFSRRNKELYYHARGVLSNSEAFEAAVDHFCYQLFVIAMLAIACNLYTIPKYLKTGYLRNRVDKANSAFKDWQPVAFVENKLLIPIKLKPGDVLQTGNLAVTRALRTFFRKKKKSLEKRKGGKSSAD